MCGQKTTKQLSNIAVGSFSSKFRLASSIVNLCVLHLAVKTLRSTLGALHRSLIRNHELDVFLLAAAMNSLRTTCKLFVSTHRPKLSENFNNGHHVNDKKTLFCCWQHPSL